MQKEEEEDAGAAGLHILMKNPVFTRNARMSKKNTKKKTEEDCLYMPKKEYKKHCYTYYPKKAGNAHFIRD